MTYDAILQWVLIAAYLVGAGGFIGLVVGMRPWMIPCPPLSGRLTALSGGVCVGAIIVGSAAAVATVLFGPA